MTSPRMERHFINLIICLRSMSEVICKMHVGMQCHGGISQHRHGSYLLNDRITDISADVIEVDVDALWAALLDPQEDILGAVVDGMMEA